MARKPKKEVSMRPITRILKLRSGEVLVSELVYDNKDMIVLTCPARLEIYPVQDENGNLYEKNVLKRWVEGTKDFVFCLFVDDVMLVCEPDDTTWKMYEQFKSLEIASRARSVLDDCMKKAEPELFGSASSNIGSTGGINRSDDDEDSGPWNHEPRISPDPEY